jgi:hypothetical protein
MKIHPSPFIFLLLFFLILLGCATTPSVPREHAAPFSYGADAEKFIETTRIDGIFKAMAHIEVNIGGKRSPPIRIALMLKLPSLMKIETIPVIGPPDFFLSVIHDTFKVFMPAKQKFYQGRASRENMALFFPISLSPKDMARILMGLPPEITGKNLKFSEGAGSEIRSVDVLSSDDKKIMTLRMDGTNNRLTGMDIFTPYGEILYTVNYKGYFKTEGNWLPQGITIFSPGTNSTIAVRYSDMELSRGMDETFFDLALPGGMQATILDPEGSSQ